MHHGLQYLGLIFKVRRRARRRMVTLFTLAIVLSALVIPFYCIYKPPSLLISYFQWRWPDVLWHVPTSSKVIALTIDDGPSEYTEEILDILQENNATATFFVIGSQALGKEKILERIVQNGNELGNHAMHDEPSRSLGDNTLKDQIYEVDSMIGQAYRTAEVEPPPKYFRPGSGFFNERMRRLITQIDYHLVLGSIYPHDPQIQSWRLNARHVLSMSRDGGIVICHDRRSWTAPMLRRVLPELRRRGYRVVTVTGLLQQASM